MAPLTPQTVTFTGSRAELPAWIHHVLAQIPSEDTHELISTLDNDINPIFDFSRWTGLRSGLYEKLRPALQLASLWLTDDRVLDWFYQDTVGDLRWESVNGMEWPYLAQEQDLEAEPDHRDRLRRRWITKLVSLRYSTRFFFYAGYKKFPSDTLGCTFPFASDLDRYKDDPDVVSADHVWEESGQWDCIEAGWPYSGDETTQPGILISDVFEETLEKGDEVCYLNCCFSLAVTLVHEIAHAAHSWPHFRYIEPSVGYYGEVFSSRIEMMEQITPHHEEQPEAGYSWERSLFGGLKAPEPIAEKAYADPKLTTALQSPFRVLKRTSGPGEVCICSSKAIARWFQNETWCSFRQVGETYSLIQAIMYLNIDMDHQGEDDKPSTSID